MDYMPWIPAYSVGVETIDQQHKHLVSMVNGMMEVLKGGAKPEQVKALLEDLMDYTQRHFRHEEGMMARAGYSGLEEHKKKHAAMQAEVARLQQEASAARATAPLKLMEFLKNWLAKHINGTDKEYVPAMKAAGLT